MPVTPTSTSTASAPHPPPGAPDRHPGLGLDVDTAARLAGVKASTIRTWINRNHLTRRPDGTLDAAAVWRCARDRRTADEAARLRHAAALFTAQDLHSA